MLRRLRAIDARHLAFAILLAWAIALVVAAVRLDAWRGELSRLLVQLNADAQFRHRLAASREAVDPEWYRRKALALLAASEKLEGDSLYTIAIPGSWRQFDDLEERLAARFAGEFGDIVVETMRRELRARAARLTGGAGDDGAPEPLHSGDCAAPPLHDAGGATGGPPEKLPEYVAVREFLFEAERLDRALRSFLALQRSGTAAPGELRELVRYTLGAEIPGNLARSLPWFRIPEDSMVQPALMQSALQAGVRCALLKGMDNLYTRLLASSELFALEQALRQRSRGLFDGAIRPVSFDATAEGYQAVLALLRDQERLLAGSGSAWMRHGASGLGSGHQELLARIGRISLLGPEVIAQLHAHSGAAFARFRRQFEELFGSGANAGIVWVDGQERFALAPERAALREGLETLLQERFMREAAARPPGAALDASDAAGWFEARQRFMAFGLPRFPEEARAPVARMVDARVADLIYQHAQRAMKAARPTDISAPLDAARYAAEGEQVREVRAMLDDLGARSFSARLWALHTEPVVRRFAVLDAEWQQLALLNSALATDFAAWQGDGPALAPGSDAEAVRRQFAAEVKRAEAIAARAASLVAAAGEPEIARLPAAQRWKKFATELQRWRSRSKDSSLAALQHFIAESAAGLHRDNCLARLATQWLPPHDDGIAPRLAQQHAALYARCLQLAAHSY